MYMLIYLEFEQLFELEGGRRSERETVRVSGCRVQLQVICCLVGLKVRSEKFYCPLVGSTFNVQPLSIYPSQWRSEWRNLKEVVRHILCYKRRNPTSNRRLHAILSLIFKFELGISDSTTSGILHLGRYF